MSATFPDCQPLRLLCELADGRHAPAVGMGTDAVAKSMLAIVKDAIEANQASEVDAQYLALLGHEIGMGHEEFKAYVRNGARDCALQCGMCSALARRLA